MFLFGMAWGFVCGIAWAFWWQQTKDDERDRR
jgi:hypothetical protein